MKELVQGLEMLTNGTETDKLTFLFRVYDLDGKTWSLSRSFSSIIIIIISALTVLIYRSYTYTTKTTVFTERITMIN